jgi:hypothetical protein
LIAIGESDTTYGSPNKKADETSPEMSHEKTPRYDGLSGGHGRFQR